MNARWWNCYSNQPLLAMSGSPSGRAGTSAWPSTGASWIKQVERFFANLTDKQIRRGVHRSTGELEAAIKDDINATNADPKPFKWTKSATDFLTSIQRFCPATLKTADNQVKILRTSESGH